MTPTTSKELVCKHIFHLDCLARLTTFHCPLCRDPINMKEIFNINMNDIICMDDIYHYGLGYAPNIVNGPCRFCLGRPLIYYINYINLDIL
jgi:hypothetical protein